jgi:hypothetical protein
MDMPLNARASFSTGAALGTPSKRNAIFIAGDQN